MTRLTGGVGLGPGLAVLTVAGDVDDRSLPQLGAMLDAAVLNASDLTVDLSRLVHLDEGAVALLVGAADRVREDSHQLTVVGPGTGVERRLRQAGLAPRPGAPSGRALVNNLAVRAWSGPTREVLDAALRLVVTMAQAVIGRADGVSITLPRDGVYCTVAASNDVVLAMDHDQYDTGQGPCLEAARSGQAVHVDDLGRELRWDDFVPRARARGIVSILSSPLRDTEQPHGALNLYSTTDGAFARLDKSWADDFAAEASTVLTTAHRALPSERLAGHLDQALRSRSCIAQAQGLVMHRDGLGADAAYQVLVEASRSSGWPMFQVCEALLRPGRQGGPGS